MFGISQSNCKLWNWDGRDEWICKVGIPAELRDDGRHHPRQRVSQNQEFPFHTNTPIECTRDKIRVYFSTDAEKEFIDYVLVEIAENSRIYKITSVDIKMTHATEDGITEEIPLAQVTNTTGNSTSFPFWFHNQGSRLKDALHLIVRISVQQADIILPSESAFPASSLPKKPIIIPNKYSKFYDSPKFVDVTLNLEDGFRYPCHRLVLADNSPVFAQMFEYETTERIKREVEVKGVSGRTMKEFLQFLYTGTCDSLEKKDVGRAIKLYLIADRYLVDDLKYFCGEIMGAGITVGNCLRIWELANCFHELASIKKALMEFGLARRKLGGEDDMVLIQLAKKCLPWKACGWGCSFCDI